MLEELERLLRRLLALPATLAELGSVQIAERRRPPREGEHPARGAGGGNELDPVGSAGRLVPDVFEALGVARVECGDSRVESTGRLEPHRRRGFVEQAQLALGLFEADASTREILLVLLGERHRARGGAGSATEYSRRLGWSE